MLIICLILLVLLGLVCWLGYRNLNQPYVKAPKALPLKAQLKLQSQARRQITEHAPHLKWLYYCLQACWWIGVLCLLVSSYLVATKLPLLIFPVWAVVTSVILLIVGIVLLMIPALVWTTQSYDYLISHESSQASFTLATTHDFQRYRRQQLWQVLALDLLILVGWISWAYRVSMVPVATIEYLVMVAIIAIPVVALIGLLVQLPYLYQNRYLTSDTARFGTLHYQANRALIKQQPDLKVRVITVNVIRMIGYLLGLTSFWLLYTNIIAPAFTVNTAIVYPAGVVALIALVIVQTISILWPTKLYDYLQLLDTSKLSFKLAGSDRFRKFRYHLTYFQLTFSILWIVLWVIIIAYHYYFG